MASIFPTPTPTLHLRQRQRLRLRQLQEPRVRPALRARALPQERN